MNIAIIGTGNVGSALAHKWAKAAHNIHLGVRDRTNFKNKDSLVGPNFQVKEPAEAVQTSDVILIATPAVAAVEVARSLGDTNGKVIIDSMNIVMGRGTEEFTNTSDAILANTATDDVVKCFNSTGFNNMVDPVYHGDAIEMYMAGGSVEAKERVKQLAIDAGFSDCIDVGGNDKYHLLEQFANFWINLAMMQGHGREMAFKLLKR